MEDEKEKRLYLYWIDNNSGKRYFAGVAFREEKYGEYRLKIDCYPERKFYLKESKTQEDCIVYRVEECKKIKDCYIRILVGQAYSHRETDGNVEMIIAPNFESKLVLTFDNAA